MQTALLLGVWCLVLGSTGCSTAIAVDDRQDGLGCADLPLEQSPPTPVTSEEQRTSFAERLTRRRCEVSVEVVNFSAQPATPFGCAPTISIPTTAVAHLLMGERKEVFGFDACGTNVDLGAELSTFARPGPRSAVVEVTTEREYAFGPDASGKNERGGPGICIVGVKESVAMRLTDVPDVYSKKNTFSTYTYREVEQRPAVECDAIVDTFR